MEICCEDSLSKSKLRERFSRAGLSSKKSNYRFLNELREASGQYIKRSNIALVNHIIQGLSTSPLEKTIPLNINAILKADDHLLKASFGDLRRKVGKYLKKWLKRPPKPKGKVQVVYDPTQKDDLNDNEWQNLDDIVFNYLKDEQSPEATEMLMEAYRMGIQSGEIMKEGTGTERDLSDMSFSDMKEWRNMRDFAEKLQDQGMADDWAYAAAWAKDRAAEYVAVYEDGERKGKAYEKITEMFREQIRHGLENGEDVSKLRTRLIFPESWVDVEGRLKDLSEKLTPEELQQYTVAHLNRDWDRLAFNEIQTAFNHGKLVRWSRFDKAYVKFARVRNRGDSCKFCLAHRNTICRVFPSEQAFAESEFYGGRDVVVGDDIADVAVWPGKTNVDRPQADWWICAPAHPWCNDDFIIVA